MKNKRFFLLVIVAIIAMPSVAFSNQAGFATYYTAESCSMKEGTSGVFTASGERYIETDLTAAMRSRNFGRICTVKNTKNGLSVDVKHNDFGPGKKQSQRGVVIDLSPTAYDALGGKRGVTKSGIAWGEMSVEVTCHD